MNSYTRHLHSVWTFTFFSYFFLIKAGEVQEVHEVRMARIHTHKICPSHSAGTFTIPLISYLHALTKGQMVYQVRLSTLFPKHLHMKHSSVWRIVFYFLLMTHLCGDLGHTGVPGEIIHKPCTTPSTQWMIVFHFPPLTYKGQKGEIGKNAHIISQTPPHETLKYVCEWLFSTFLHWHTKDKKVKQVRMSTVFPKHLHMKHSNVWRTVFYFLLMTHLCGDLGDPGPPGETIHKAMHYTLTLWMMVFHFPPWTYKGPDGVPGKNVHTIS